MDLVRDFEAAFNAIKDNPVKDVSELVAVIKKHGRDPNDSSTWRWDVMRSVVSDDMDYVKLVTAMDLKMCYEDQRKIIEKEPEVLKVTAMLLHAHYDNYHKLVDVVSIQKDVFGDVLFSKIEEATIAFLDRLVTKMVSSDNVHGMTHLDYAKYMYQSYASEYEDYYYWPHMKASMDKVMDTIQ